MATTQVGTNSPNLTVNATSEKDGYEYYCVVTDSSGQSVTSDTAILTVNPAQTGTKPVAKLNQPTSNPSSAQEGDTVTLRMELLSGTPPFTYTWYKNGSILQTLADVNTLYSEITTTANQDTDLVDTMQIMCNVSNTYGEAENNPHTLNVTVTDVPTGTAPQITTDLDKNIDVTEGDPLVLTVAATGDPEPTYEWYEVSIETVE